MRENVIFSCVNSPKLKQNCQVLFSLSRKLQNQTKEHHFDQFFSKLRNFVSLFFRKKKITFYPKSSLGGLWWVISNSPIQKFPFTSPSSDSISFKRHFQHLRRNQGEIFFSFFENFLSPPPTPRLIFHFFQKGIFSDNSGDYFDNK